MGWVESPYEFYAVSETGHDVAQAYIDSLLGSLSDHTFLELTQGSPEYAKLPTKGGSADLKYLLEMFVGDFVSHAVPTSSA